MSDSQVGYVVGVALGLLLGMLITLIVLKEEHKLGKHGKSLIALCEQELPRNQKCHIKAIEEELDNV